MPGWGTILVTGPSGSPPPLAALLQGRNANATVNLAAEAEARPRASGRPGAPARSGRAGPAPKARPAACPPVRPRLSPPGLGARTGPRREPSGSIGAGPRPRAGDMTCRPPSASSSNGLVTPSYVNLSTSRQGPRAASTTLGRLGHRALADHRHRRRRRRLRGHADRRADLQLRHRRRRGRLLGRLGGPRARPDRPGGEPRPQRRRHHLDRRRLVQHSRTPASRCRRTRAAPTTSPSTPRTPSTSTAPSASTAAAAPTPATTACGLDRRPAPRDPAQLRRNDSRSFTSGADNVLRRRRATDRLDLCERPGRGRRPERQRPALRRRRRRRGRPGAAGSDSLFGDDGDDALIGGDDDDAMRGGSDDDACRAARARTCSRAATTPTSSGARAAADAIYRRRRRRLPPRRQRRRPARGRRRGGHVPLPAGRVELRRRTASTRTGSSTSQAQDTIDLRTSCWAR